MLICQLIFIIENYGNYKHQIFKESIILLFNLIKIAKSFIPPCFFLFIILFLFFIFIIFNFVIHSLIYSRDIKNLSFFGLFLEIVDVYFSLFFFNSIFYIYHLMNLINLRHKVLKNDFKDYY